MDKTVCELFAGVGGFRVGLDKLNSGWNTVWFSQWEPNKKKQWAHDCYVYHYGDCVDLNNEFHTGEDIGTVDKTTIPDHTLLVGGFPCQPFSVSRTGAKGLDDKEKGILWWQIRDIIMVKRPAFCIFENVDRLIKSPSSKRGRDFGVILSCLYSLGYCAEWRVVNAADYGSAQRRRRTFIFAYKNDTVYAKSLSHCTAVDILTDAGFMAKSFPIVKQDDLNVEFTTVANNPNSVYSNFCFGFKNAGFMRYGDIYTTDVTPDVVMPVRTLRDIMEKGDVDSSFCISSDKMDKWTYLKGAKKIPRTSKSGHSYIFSEGAIAFPDDIDKPSRTMLTSESKLNRSTHVVTDIKSGKLRVLTPIETERLQGFDDDWTKSTTIGDMPLNMRYFCMGNALVTSMITRMGKVLDDIVNNEI